MPGKYFYLIMIFFIAWTACFASETPTPVYKISDIPNNLLKNAKMVIRKSVINIEIGDNGAVEEHHLVVSILNKNGDNYAIFNEHYNKYSSISDFHLTIYDSEGKKFKSYGYLDLIDICGLSSYSLYEDTRVKYFDPLFKKYPFTIDVTFKRKINSLLFLSNWVVYPDYNCSIESTSLTINTKLGSGIKFHESNMPVICKVLSNMDGILYFWRLQNLEAFSKEDYEQPFQEFTPMVYLISNEFDLENTKGDYVSWLSFGKWYSLLIEGRDVISAETKLKMEKMTQGLNEYQKICLVYQYMQKYTRYVSIQVGIGGWQPFDAKTVDRLGYGDCKALANYTYALLKCIGIKSYPVLINAGENAPSLIADFPSNYFNHMILMVPCEKDTVFLECTNPYIPAGHIGDFTDNRFALMVTDTGGVLIKTRNYSQDENLTSSNINVELNMIGSSKASIKTIYRNCDFDKIKYLSLSSNEDIGKSLSSRLNIADFLVNSFSYQQLDSAKPIIVENISLDLHNYAATLDKQAFIPLNLNNKINDIPNVTEERKSKIIIKRYSTTIDTVTYIIPSNYSVDRIPKDIIIESDFGYYQSKCMMDESKVTYIRKLVMAPCIFPPSYATQFKDFFIKVRKADLAQLVLLQK